MATSHHREIITLLFILAISELIQSQGPTLDPNTMIECTTNHSCEGSPVTSTMKDCCDHDIEPSGFAYTIPGVEVCHLCPVDFGFNQSTFSGIEQGENYRIPVEFFSGGVEQGVFINVNLNLSGTAGGNDINLVTTQLRFLPGTIQQNLEFSLRVDNIARELDETFVITLEVPDGTFNPGANIRNRLEGVIIDSDEIDFTLSEEDYTQNEEPNAVLEVLITKGSGVALANPVYFRATFMTVDDAITMGVISEFEDENPLSPNRANYEDFDNTTLFATFPIDNTVLSRELRIPIVDDDIDEADEQVFIIFLEVVNATNFNKVNVGRKTSIGRIKDDETTRIGFEHQSYEVTEPTEAEELIRNLVYLIREDNRKSEQIYSVDLTVGDPGGNTKPATIETSNTNQSFDYSFGLVNQTKQNVLFPPTVDRIPFVFSLNPDLAVEGTETFRTTSAQVTPSGDFPVFQTPSGVNAFATTLINILDNDELIVRFEELNYTVSESAGTVEICVVVTNPLPTADLDVTIVLSPSTIDGTAEAGSDFTKLTEFLSISLVFPSSPGSPTAEARRECFNVTITDDDLFENAESFFLLLQEDIFGQQTGATINPNQTEINIFDNDEVVNIVFIGAPFEGREGSGFVAITVGVMEPEKLKTKVSVNLTTGDIVGISNAATAGVDYRPLDVTLTFSETATVITVNITLLNDNTLEGDEDFKARLSTISGSNVGLPVPDAIITIVDDDRVTTIGFESATYSVDEGDVVEVCVVLTGTLEKSVEVLVNSSSESATSTHLFSQDYIPVLETLTFGPTTNRACFNFTTVEDIFEEDIEDVNLYLNTMTINVTLNPELAQVHIRDGDSSPFICRNLRVLQEMTRTNTIIVTWERPLITGIDYYYDIFYSDPEKPGNFKKHNRSPFINNYSIMMYSLSGLKPLTSYTIRVVVRNGMRNQHPEGEEGRRCEVSVTTGDIRAQPPRSVTSFCSVIVWKAPTRAYGEITGYEVSFSLPDGGDNGIISKDRDEFFHAVRASELPRGEGDILVMVRAKTMSQHGTWSDAISLNCTGIASYSSCPGF